MTDTLWKHLESSETFQEATHKSLEVPVLIYKHSTRCSISSMVLARLERAWDASQVPHLEKYFLDLITFRDISDTVARHFEVHHESPQVLLIVAGKCVFHTSHLGISFDVIAQAVTQNSES